MLPITLNSKGSDLVDKDFNWIVSKFQTSIFKMIYFRVRSAELAEELTQVTFIQVHKSISSLSKKNSIKSWLYRIASNKINDHFRKQKIASVFKQIDVDDEKVMDPQGNSPLDQLLQREFWDQIRGLLSKMPKSEKEVFTLRFLDQLSIKEISCVMGRSQSTIKTHLYRALRKYQQNHELQTYLEEVRHDT